MKHSDIIHELQTAGASKQEALELQKFAKKVSRQYKHPRLSGRKKRAIAKEIGIGREWFAMRTIAVAAYAAVAAIIIMPVVIGQFSLPGDPLYFVKRGTEKVRGVVQPSYAEKEAERREAEVNALKASGASEDTIKKAEEAVKTNDDNTEANNEAGDDNSTSTSTTNTSTQTQTQTQNRNGDDDNRSSTPSTTVYITKEQATTIAKNKMAIESPTKKFESCSDVKSDNDGTKIYECKFSNGGLVIVNAINGTIKSFKP